MFTHLRHVTFALGLLVLGTHLVAQEPVKTEEPATVRKITKAVTPAYPVLARQANITGTVKLVAVVTPEGTVKSVKTVGGNPLLVTAAEDAVKQWKFEASKKESNEFVALKFQP